MAAAAHEARFYESRPDGRVLCTLCPHDCLIADGGRGACAVRYQRGGRLYTLVYDKVVAREVNPIEKKPLFHFQPGSHAYSISTAGCNLRCSYCQNWQISQWPRQHLPKRVEPGGEGEPEPICPQLDALDREIPGEPVTPEGLVGAALASGCASMSYTFTEPTIFFELVQDTAVLARERGLKNTLVTNGFINEAPLREFATVVDAANVDLKFFREESYRRISRARLEPVLAAIRLYHELGVWLEVTTLVIPGVNDSDQELGEIAAFLCALDPGIPWHVSGYYPAWKMLDHPPTPVETLRHARDIGLSAGLRHVYVGNVMGDPGENTWCPSCRGLLIERFGFAVRVNRIESGRCPHCGTLVEGVEMSGGAPD